MIKRTQTYKQLLSHAHVVEDLYNIEMQRNADLWAVNAGLTADNEEQAERLYELTRHYDPEN